MTERSFSDILAAEAIASRRKCNLSLALQKMDAEAVKDVKSAMGRGVSAAVISRALANYDTTLNLVVSEGSIRRCRRNLCPCWEVVSDDKTGAK